MAFLVPGTVSFASVQPGWQRDLWIQDYESGIARSRHLNRPAIVYFDALWCSWCQQFKREVLDHPKVKARLKAGFIPIIIDFDARPDLFNQFSGKGLPYTVLLSPEGKVLNRFVGILTVVDFLDLLDQPARRAINGSVLATGFAETVRVRTVDRSGLRDFRDAFLRHLETLYSPELQTLAGQFETGATLKRPSPRTWSYLATRNLWPERIPMAVAAERSRLLDPHDGGFFNFLDPGRADGDYLESSKLLEANARLVEWFAGAARKDAAAAAAADSGWHYLREVLWDKGHGGFWQSQLADNRYYAAPLAKRIKLAPPAVDRIKRADTNAEAALSLWRAGQFRNNPEMMRYAQQTLKFLLQHMVRDGVLYHLKTGSALSVPALPEDWFWLLLAAREIKPVLTLPEQHGQDQVTAHARHWLQDQMRRDVTPTVELASLIAQVTCDGGKDRPELPAGACQWSLGHLRIERDTSPDDVVPGIEAWERLLDSAQS